jgi:2-hydroxycyclohexanecarboxyl-CoA dehydrogenase
MSGRRVAVVTGGGSGMGRAIVHRFARDGLLVAILDIDADAAAVVEKEVRDEGNEALAVGAVDVSDRSQVEAAMDHVREVLGPIVVLVNNAGITGFREFLKITDEKWDRIMAVNLNGPFYCTQAVVPDMIAAGWGRIVNISSSSAQGGQQYMVHYVTSKAGLIGMTKALALELGPHGITANSVAPGEIATKMTGQEDEDPHGTHRDLPVPRPGHAREIAGMVCFLASPEGAYTTGQSLVVDGGMSLKGPIDNRG